MPTITEKIKNLASDESINGRISNRAKFFLAFPGMPIALSNTLIHNAYIKFYTDMVGLDVRYVGILYLIFGIWNAINDPALGILIDRFKYRPNRGKYVYLMRVTAPVTVFSAFAMIFAQPTWEQWLVFAFMLVLLFIYDTTQTAFVIAHTAYIYVAAPTNEERVDVSVVRTYIAHVGGFFGTIVPTLLLVGETNRQLTIILFSCVLILNAFLYYFALKPLQDKEEMYKDDFESEEGAFAKQLRENARDALTSRAFITYILYQFFARGPIMVYFTPFLYLMDYVLRLNGGQATVVDVLPGLIMFICAPFIGRASKRLGVRKVGVYSAIPLALAFLSLFVIQSMWQAILAYTAVIVLSQFPNILHVPMLGAIVDEDEQRTGNRKAGLYTGLNALLTIPVGGMHTVAFTSILAAYTFVSGAEVQSEQALLGIRIGASVIPFISILISIVPMWFSPITLEKEHELSAFSEQQHRSQEEATPAAG